MTVRQLRPVVGAVVLLLMGWMTWVVVGIRRPTTRVEPILEATGAAALPPKDEETGCFDDFVLDWAGDHVEAARACKAADGSSLLQDGVVIRLKDDAGEDEVTLRAEKGTLPAVESMPVELSGKVQVETPGPTPLVLDGEVLTIDKANEVVRSSQPVTFSQGEVSGSAGALEHAWKTRVTRLMVQPVVVIQGERTDGRSITLRADVIERREATKLVTLVGKGRIDFQNGSVEGERVDVQLSEDGMDVVRVDARGSARTTTLMPLQAGSGLEMERILSGEHVVHEFEPGSKLSSVEADGGATLRGRPSQGSTPTEDLVAHDVRLEFLTANGVQLDTVRARGVPAAFERVDAGGTRKARGNELSVRLEPGGGVEKLTSTGAARLEDATPNGRKVLEAESAELRFAPGGQVVREIEFAGKGGAPGTISEERPSGPRSLAARKGKLVLDDSGQPTSGTLDGDVELKDPQSRARSDKAEVSGPPQKTILTGHAQVERGGNTSHGDRIVRDDGDDTLVVEGTQHTIVRDARGLPGMESAAASTEPTYVSSDKLVFEEKKRRATYSGGRPSLRRGDTEIVADTIVVDDAQGTLDATGSVESRLRLTGAAAAKPAEPGALFDPTKVVHGRSAELHYGRKESIVKHSGDVKLEQEAASIAADRVDIGLEPATSQVKWLDADGSALFHSPDREAEGRRIEYRADDGSVKVFAGRRPARARDSKGQFVSGGIVAFGKDGTVSVLSPTSGRSRGSAPSAGAPVSPTSPATPNPPTGGSVSTPPGVIR